MKKILLISALLIGTLTLTGCGKEENVSKAQKWNIETKELASSDFYLYEFDENTEIMCRNLPEWYKKSWTNEKPYPLKNIDLSDKELISLEFAGNGKRYFGISYESDLGNPVITFSLTAYESEKKGYFGRPIRCEISNPKDEYKEYKLTAKRV